MIDFEIFAKFLFNNEITMCNIVNTVLIIKNKYKYYKSL